MTKDDRMMLLLEALVAKVGGTVPVPPPLPAAPAAATALPSWVGEVQRKDAAAIASGVDPDRVWTFAGHAHAESSGRPLILAQAPNENGTVFLTRVPADLVRAYVNGKVKGFTPADLVPRASAPRKRKS